MKQIFKDITKYLTESLEEAILAFPNDSIPELISFFLDDERYIELKREIDDCFVYDQDIWGSHPPIEIAELFLDIECGQIAFWLLNGDLAPESTVHTIGFGSFKKIKEVYLKGQEAKKRLYSLLPGLSIKENVLAKEKQLDPAKVLNDHIEKEKLYAKMFEYAKEYMNRTGESVYFPYTEDHKFPKEDPEKEDPEYYPYKDKHGSIIDYDR